MRVRMTLTTIDPAMMAEARALYKGDAISGVIRQQPGHRFHYLMESTTTPGEAISITAWDSQESADAYERSGVYAELVGKLTPWFTGAPKLSTYDVPE